MVAVTILAQEVTRTVKSRGDDFCRKPHFVGNQVGATSSGSLSNLGTLKKRLGKAPGVCPTCLRIRVEIQLAEMASLPTYNFPEWNTQLVILRNCYW